MSILSSNEFLSWYPWVSSICNWQHTCCCCSYAISAIIDPDYTLMNVVFWISCWRTTLGHRARYCKCQASVLQILVFTSFPCHRKDLKFEPEICSMTSMYVQSVNDSDQLAATDNARLVDQNPSRASNDHIRGPKIRQYLRRQSNVRRLHEFT